MKVQLSQHLPKLWYPLIVGGVLLVYQLLQLLGAGLVWSTYVPIILAVIAIILLEQFFPFNPDWKPTKSDVIYDSSFIVVVQLLLPQCLSYAAALIFVSNAPSAFSFWPSELPVLIQVIMMILIADFMRYWLHRAFHRKIALWQFHAVHHSPRKLYWLNVGRFHPIDKATQFLFDALPFIILGVNETVLSLYFVFYAVNGYLQHCNINLKMGWLNYLISSAELHRWHHSVKPSEADRNFGNNTILWDLVFGTYYLPKNAQVEKLGLKNDTYPVSFLDQMKTPFIPRLESRSLPLISYREIMINMLFKVRLNSIRARHWPALILATRNPRKAQLKILQEILSINQNSKFGQNHHFQSIRHFQEFRDNCPIQTYDSLSDYFNFDSPEIRQGLTTESPEFYQVTSGTTGPAKYLPMTPLGLKRARSLQKLVALARQLDNPYFYIGKIFAVVSPAIEGQMKSGVPFGSASGLIYQHMPLLARAKYVVPYAVFEIKQYDVKYTLMAVFALSESRVSLVPTANPSTLVRLLEVINSEIEALLLMVETGQISMPDLSPRESSRLSARLKPRPERAHFLRDIVHQKGRLTYKDIWPHLQQVITWTGGSCGIPLSSLKGDLPAVTQIVELGYQSSEFTGTVTLGKNKGLPTLTHHFFEFIERSDWEQGVQNIKLLDELKLHQQYYIIVTTLNGLYRYFMNDIIEVTGRFNKTPTLQFLQKGKGATNITGEKLYENQIHNAIRLFEAKHKLLVRFHQCLANEQASRYQLYLELAEGSIDDELEFGLFFDEALATSNIEYDQKRQSNRLHTIEVSLLKPGTGDAFKRQILLKGQREGQYKVLSLIYLKDSDFDFRAHLLNSKL